MDNKQRLWLIANGILILALSAGISLFISWKMVNRSDFLLLKAMADQQKEIVGLNGAVVALQQDVARLKESDLPTSNGKVRDPFR